jgi:hypothetical protein
MGRKCLTKWQFVDAMLVREARITNQLWKDAWQCSSLLRVLDSDISELIATVLTSGR